MIQTIRRTLVAVVLSGTALLSAGAGQLPDLSKAKPLSDGICHAGTTTYRCALVELNSVRYIIVVDAAGILAVARVKPSAGIKPNYNSDEFDNIYLRDAPQKSGRNDV
jgi:hypothetical protein